MAPLKQWSSDGLLTPRSVDQLNFFLDLLLEWNQRINLTGLRSREEMEEILIGESILALRVFPLSHRKVLDVGSGAGIPGLVWLIADPSIHLTSLEIRAKKVAFQKEALRQLGLQAEIVLGHFPEAVAGRVFDVIATRAVCGDDLLPSEQLLAEHGSLLRFAPAGASEEGWKSHPVSPRSSLLVRRV